jgi:hypothetical protein
VLRSTAGSTTMSNSQPIGRHVTAS